MTTFLKIVDTDSFIFKLLYISERERERENDTHHRKQFLVKNVAKSEKGYFFKNKKASSKKRKKN